MDGGSDFSVRVESCIANIDKNEWERVFPPIAESYNFFKTLEQTLSSQFRLFYVLIYEGPDIVCLAPCFVMDYPLDTTVSGPFKRVLSLARSISPHLFNVRAVICGSPTSDGRIGVKDPRAADAVITALVGAMETVAQLEGIRMLAFKDFLDRDASLLEPLARLGLYKVRSFPTVELDIHFSSFEDYLSSLSKATRKDLRRKFKKLNGVVPITVEVRDDLGDLLDEAYALYLQTLEKSDVVFETMPKEFFRAVSRNVPEHSKFFLWRLVGKLVAFVYCLVEADTLTDKYIGMDYEAAYRYHLYFVTFRDIMRWCIAHGIRRYESPQLNYDPKKRLDFAFVPNYVYVRHVNRAMNYLVGYIARLLKPENFDPVLKSLERQSRRSGARRST
jgi:predicted N-acyltransferase